MANIFIHYSCDFSPHEAPPEELVKFQEQLEWSKLGTVYHTDPHTGEQTALVRDISPYLQGKDMPFELQTSVERRGFHAVPDQLLKIPSRILPPSPRDIYQYTSKDHDAVHTIDAQPPSEENFYKNTTLPENNAKPH